MWIPFIGDDSLTCEREEHNENVKWSKVASKFLLITNCHIRVEVIGKRVNRGVELGLKIPVNFFLWRCKSYNTDEK